MIIGFVGSRDATYGERREHHNNNGNEFGQKPGPPSAGIDRGQPRMDRSDALIQITETRANMVDIGRLRPDLDGSETRLYIVDGSGIRGFVGGGLGSTDYTIIGRRTGVGRQFSLARVTAVGRVVRVLII